MENSDFKGALAEQLSIILYRNLNPQSKLPTICKERFMVTRSVIYSQKNFYLIDALNKVIANMMAAGLISYWHSKELDRFSVNDVDSKQPQVIKVSHLLGCFQLLVCGFILSFFCLLVEIAIKKLGNKIVGFT